ncbi:uncharacterized protein I303_104424 [Kwoniella dejecticola CBS 10117]|uniref:Vacuolar protein-sorting-associated protein 36 n=1 Tax=Kwoniella dejecticola CBS 10117 TaxID=1296121 RepID=A0A1A6A5C9_9TREE|nr:ESCRT-II complex subunit VPS36 [Kwoniella dejecticola CBS 10117]OBR85264.1 ESCRT-II complex subunit VPS36 [Kwoniella dejecticola CBS 10117]
MSRSATVSSLPNGLSADYWSTWSPIRTGSSVSESVDKNAGEEWIGSWDGVGLYEGNNKVPSYQSITVHLTNNRLILIPDPFPSPSSSSSSGTSSNPLPSRLAMHLSFVRQTEFYAGFMRSSAKITLTLGPQPSSSSASAPISNEQDSSSPRSTIPESVRSNGWTCNICGYINPTDSHRQTPLPSSKCGLCGIPYSTSQLSVSATPSRSNTPSNVDPVKPSPAPTPDVPPPDSGTSRNTSNNEDGMISCPACTFLNSPLLPNCEICSTPLPRTSTPTSTKPVGEVSSPAIAVPAKPPDVVRLSFRKGGVQEAYKKLKAVLSDKAWERGVTSSSPMLQRAKSDNGDTIDGLPRSGAGIDGILQQIDLNSKSHSNQMTEAFADLEALMLRAGEMVKLAHNINSKLTAQLASAPAGAQRPTEEETTMIRSSLVQLGLAAPAVTKEMIRDEQRYHQSLAKELGELLTGRKSYDSGTAEGLMVGKNGRGVIALDEVWGLWMRARGVSLLPPSTLISILPIISVHTSPAINALTLPSSLQVLHTPHYSTLAILSRTLDRLDPLNGDEAEPQTERGISSLEFSDYESLPIGLAKEFIELLEKPGEQGTGLVRDDQSSLGEGGVRWYRDIITGWPVNSM